jgi:tetratricopeptide (TPR) repeat protein
MKSTHSPGWLFSPQVSVLLSLGYVLIASMAVTAAPSWHEPMRRGIETFRAGLHRWNDDTLARAQRLFTESRRLTAPDSLWSYWLGTTLFYRVSYSMYGPEGERDEERVESLAARALTALEPCRGAGAMRGECRAVTATLYGQQIALNPMRAMRLGPRIQELRAAALAADSLNPRVWHLVGVNYFYAPALFGGGPARAVPFFLKADSLFATARHPRSDFAPRWGRAVNASFLGQAYYAMEMDEEALRWLEQAVAMNPHDYLARRRIEELRSGS